MAQSSGVLREVWTNLDGNAVSDLTGSLHYPAHPVYSVIDADFKSPVDWCNRYGVRMRALLTAPTSGSYTFWVSGDDNCELWLSTDESPDHRVRIATVPGWTAAQTWTAFAEQKSAAIILEAGRRYYIEALMKEGGGGDSLAVAWAASPSTTPLVIPGANLTPYAAAPAPTGTLLVEAGDTITQYSPNFSVTLAAQALNLAKTNAAPSIQWTQVSGAAAAIATPAAETTTLAVPAAGTYVFRATATVSGGATASDDVTVIVLPPLAADAGSALSEYWFGVSGSSVASLSNSLDYPNFPHAHRIVASLTSTRSLADQYGERTRGFILAPATGTYRFFITGDETVEFHLSSDDSPSNLQLRASVTKAVGANDFFNNAAQASSSISLVKGRRYAFEVRHKDDWGSDHYTVLWQQPNDEHLSDITGEFLAPPEDSSAAIAATQEFNPDLDFILSAGRDQVIYLPRKGVTLSAYETRRISGSDTPVRTWSQVSGPAGVMFSAPNAAATTALFPRAGTYTLRYTVATVRNSTSDEVQIQVLPAINANTGSLTRQVWWNRNYATLEAFRTDAAFPNFPDIVDTIPELRQTSDWASLYGTRVTGILNVPPGGSDPVNYTFYVSGDDLAEFSISTDASPANLRKVCYTTKVSGRENWKSESSQVSAPIALKPGGKYFVELLHKETWSSDYFAVAWTREGDRSPQVIDGSLLEPDQKAAAFDPTLNIYAAAGRDRIYYWPHDRTNLAGSLIKARDTPNTTATVWKQISGPKATVTEPASLTSEVVFFAAGVYTFELTAAEGDHVHKDAVTITVAPQISGVKGSLTRSVWLDVDGWTVDHLRAFDPTLSHPHFEDLLPGVEPPVNWTDYYGTRLAGYLTVPLSGNYTFWIASDDASELRLDLLDGNGPQKIAFLNNATSFRYWTANASQKSVTLNLTAKISYPIEVLHKEYNSSDHLSVAMDGPATNGREVLSRGFLSPLRTAPAFNPDITVVLGSDRTLLWPNNELSIAALVYDLKQGPRALAYKWSCSSAKVSFDSATSAVTVAKFAAPGVYEIKMTASDSANTGMDSLLVTVSNPLSKTAGGILREVWTGVSGYSIADLKSSSAYAAEPQYTDILSTFEAPTNWGDNYGQRLTGYLQVPADGDYVFAIASDDASEFWINATGDAPAGAQKAAYTTSASGRYYWTRYASQKSAEIHLAAGRRYYVQALQKEGGGDDYLAVAYRRADQSDEDFVVISGVLLSPPDGVKATAFDGQLSVRAGESQSAYWPHSRFKLKGAAIDYVPGPQPLAYRWSVAKAPGANAAKVAFDAPTSLESGVEFPAAGVYQLLLTATDGQISRSDSLTITISPQLAAGTGTILAEVFRNVAGSWVTDLTKSPKYPNSPDDRMQLRSTEIPSNQGDNYGMLMRGYLYAPVTGIYRFNLASDDWSEVYIGTNRSPESKALACFVPSGTDYYEWRKYPDYQLSRPIQLQKGKSYYIEIRFKESGWRDHLALAWLRPGAASFEVIDGAFLAPWLLTDKTAPTITLTGGGDITVNIGATYVDPGFTASDLADGDLTGAVTTEGSVDTSKAGTYIIRYNVTDESGNQSAIVTRRVTVAVAPNEDPVYPPDASGSYSTTGWSQSGAISDLDAARFLKQATFGPDETGIARVKAIGYSAWIDEQLALPATSHLEQLDRLAQFRSAQSTLYSLTKSAGATGLPGSMMATAASLQTEDRLSAWWTTAVTAPDQLRQRVAFALSEILVISDKSGSLRNYPRGCANYYDLLAKRIGKGGTYRDLLEDVSMNPMMATWLTLVRSSKTQPDENYAREIMQLFSIGLAHLNKDGTFKRDAAGNSLPTYSQTEILELSRALTGWTYNNSRAFTWTGNTTDDINPLMSFEEYHDRGKKVILGGATIPAGQTALQDVRRALDIIAAHPNVGPFLAKRLIQRLVTSNPSPAYIYRVSSKFENNGKGVRGDLCAVVKAILMDPEARNGASDGEAGKLSEPILRITRLLRALPKPPSDSPPILGRYLLDNASDDIGQWPLQSPTVFNFFHPEYQPPGAILDNGLYAPEFEITTELTTTDTANYFFDGILNGFYARSGPRLGLDLTPLTALWSTPEALMAKLECLLLGREFSPDMRAALMNMHTLHASSPTQGVRAMLQILSAAPEFAVER